MNTASITIEEGRVTIRRTDEGVWMTQHQIATLFGVFVSTVGTNIRSILKSEVLREEVVCRHRNTPNGGFVEQYNLEMITALSFRLKSRQADRYRSWLVEQAVNPLILWKIPNVDSVLN